MYESHSKGISYTAGFFMLIAFAIAGLALASKLAIPIWQVMTGLPFDDMKAQMSNPAYSDVLKVIQLVSALVGFFFPALITAFVLSREPVKTLGFSARGIKPGQVGLIILIIGASIFVSSGLSYFNNHFPIPDTWRIYFDQKEESYNKQVEAIVRMKDMKDYLAALFIMAFLPALCEETLFRGGLQNFLTCGTHRPWMSIIVVSIIFSLAHGSYFGFLYRFFLGIVLGAMFHYSGKLWLCILAHFLNNAFALTMFYVYTQQGKSIKEALKTDATAYWGILALPVVIVLFVVFKRISVPDRRST